MNKTKQNTAGLSTLVMQVCVPDSEAKQTEESEFAAEKSLARSFKETGSLCLKSPELLQSSFTNQMGVGSLRSACHNSLIG